MALSRDTTGPNVPATDDRPDPIALAKEQREHASRESDAHRKAAFALRHEIEEHMALARAHAERLETEAQAHDALAQAEQARAVTLSDFLDDDGDLDAGAEGYVTDQEASVSSTAAGAARTLDRARAEVERISRRTR